MGKASGRYLPVQYFVLLSVRPFTGVKSDSSMRAWALPFEVTFSVFMVSGEVERRMRKGFDLARCGVTVWLGLLAIRKFHQPGKGSPQSPQRRIGQLRNGGFVAC